MAIQTLKNKATVSNDGDADRIKPTASEQRMIDIRADGNTASRIEEEVCISSTALFTILVSILYNSDSKDADIGVSAISSFIGTLLAVGAAGAWYRFRNTSLLKHTKEPLKTQPPIPNPWARRFKTSFFIGQKAGELFGLGLFSWLGFPILHLVRNALVKVTGAIFALSFGVVGMLILKGGKDLDSIPNTRFSRDGWTKFTKTGFVYGNAFGLLIACTICVIAFPIASLPILLIIGSAAGSLLGAAAISAAVPLYHWYKLRKTNKTANDHPPTVPDKTKKTPTSSEYRTNYARAGIVLGGFIGSILAGIIVATAFPAVFLPLAITIGGAIGTLILGLVLGVLGPAIERKIEHGIKTANSFDYAIRTGSMFGNNYGLGQTFSKIPGIFGLLATSIFGLICCVGALIREIFHAKQFTKNIRAEVKKADALTGNDLELKKEALKKITDERMQMNYILPWTQKAATGVMIGYAVLGFIGFLINPLCFVIFGGIGGILGAIAACYAEHYLQKKKYIPAEPVKVSQKLEALLQSSDEKKIPTKEIIPEKVKTACSEKHFSIKNPSLLFNSFKNHLTPTPFLNNSPPNKTPLHFHKAALNKKPYQQERMPFNQSITAY